MILSRDNQNNQGSVEPADVIVDDTFNDDVMGGDGYVDDYDLYGDDILGDGSPPPMQKHSDLLKNLTDFNPYIKEAINNWLGMNWDEGKKAYVKDDNINNIMNLNGALWCAGLMKTYARGNNIITDISLDEYKYIMADIIENVWLNLGTRDDLGIVEDGDLLRVSNEIEHSAALALMGAGDGKYNKFLGTTISRSEQVRTGDDPLAYGGRGGLGSGRGGVQKQGIFRQLKKLMTGK